MADVTLTTSQPIIRIARVPNVEPGSRIALYWNGTIAANGDGVPGGANPIDYSQMLPQQTGWPRVPLLFWTRGHPHLYGGGFGMGGFGEPGASLNTAMGFGTGPFGLGAFGIGGGWWEWQPSNIWRNGVYAIAARLRDSLGNEQTAAIASFTIEIQAPPRAVPKAWVVALVGDNLTIAWRHSPDFQPA